MMRKKQQQQVLDPPTNVAEAIAMVTSTMIDGARFYDYEVDVQNQRVLIRLGDGNGVILTVEFSPATRQCGLCVMPAKFMVVPHLDEDDGTVAACEHHLDEIAGQYSRPAIEPIQAWSKHFS